MLGLLVTGIALLAPLIAYATLGWFARYTADDYCTAGAERAAGFFGAQADWYLMWSGRFTYYAVVSLVELTGPAVVCVLPAVALAAWLATSAWAVRPIATAHGWHAPWLASFVLGAGLILVCLDGAPDLDQALYWQTGMLTYLFPLILLTGLAGWLARWTWRAPSRAPSRRALAFAAVFSFVSAGVSETTLSLQLALLFLASLLLGAAALIGVRQLQSAAMLVLSALAGTAVAAVILVAAPGNAVHEISLTGSTHPLTELPEAARASVAFVELFVRSVEFRARTAVVILVAVSAWLGWQSIVASSEHPIDAFGRHAIGLMLIVLCDWLLLVAAITPGYFAQGWDPPARAQFVAVWVAAVGLLVAAYVLGRMVRFATQQLPAADGLAGLAWTVAALFLALAPLASTRTILSQLPTDAAYAATGTRLTPRFARRLARGKRSSWTAAYRHTSDSISLAPIRTAIRTHVSHSSTACHRLRSQPRTAAENVLSEWRQAATVRGNRLIEVRPTAARGINQPCRPNFKPAPRRRTCNPYAWPARCRVRHAEKTA